MKSLSLFKAALVAAVVSFLAACGGSDPAPNVGWASPAAFVPAGASSKSFGLQSCTINSASYQGDLYSASLVIASNGDVSVLAATTSTAAAVTQWSLPFAQATQSSWQVNGTVEEPYVFASVVQETTNTFRQLSLGSGSGESGMYVYESNSMFEISCNGINTVTLQINPDATRAANNLGTAAGVNTFDDVYADGSIEGGNAFWDNGYGFGSEDRRYIRFNLGSGALASATATSAAYTAISLNLPTNASGDEGSYSETLQRNSSEFQNQDAKTICLSSYSNSQEDYYFLGATAYGNKLRPFASGNINIGALPAGLEQPQVSLRGCGFLK